MTTQRLQEMLINLEKLVIDQGTMIAALQDELDNYATQNDLTNAIDELRGVVSSMSTLLVRVEKKVNNVLLPEETRMYLEEAEIDKLRDAVTENKATLVELQKMRRSLVGLMARFDLTH